ncbi:sulfatase family protein [Vallitalea okinawensis]|uniref:sulfatase family protein n=1 Tax=Vallitalea okinawensis TaxID=2078660 RepID=UPI000CFDCDE7|nr:arylsulfatase [Vallitalea okinawensis]
MNKPNIIYILADDMGYGDVSYLNERAAFKTPHLDQMCEEGISFTDAHASSAVCTPSRYSILTGRYNWRSTLKQGVLFGYDKPLIETKRQTVATYLQEKGYKTACIGKWHLGLEWTLKDANEKESIDYTKPLKDTPIDHGFDYFYGIAGSLDMPPYVYIENKQVTAIPNRVEVNDVKIPQELNKKFFRTGLTGEDFIHEEVLPNFTERVLSKIDEYKDEPFFIYFPLNAPHTPILPTREFQGRSGTNEYGDFVLMCDDVVGRVNKKLRECGLDENTIVIYTSDNGCSPMANYNELAQYGHNPSYIYRGTKADIFEGGHRVPLIIKWPQVIRHGIQSQEPVCLTDFFATIADIFRDSLEDHVAEDSVSNLPIWSEEEELLPVREALVHHSINGSFSIRKGKWKLEMCPDSGGWSVPRPGTTPEAYPPVQLYNLEEDIREQFNIYDQHPDVVEELKILLKKYIVEGRSTKGTVLHNTGTQRWEQMIWVDSVD